MIMTLNNQTKVTFQDVITKLLTDNIHRKKIRFNMTLMELQQYCGLGEYLLLGDHNLKLQVDHQSYYMSINPSIN
jgi:hypothetical protein